MAEHPPNVCSGHYFLEETAMLSTDLDPEKRNKYSIIMGYNQINIPSVASKRVHVTKKNILIG